MNTSWSSPISPLVSFADVMSEQLADSLVEEDIIKDALDNHQDSASIGEVPILTSSEPLESSDTASDEMLARMLQAEWDKEYNEKLSREEQRVNRFSKVKLSLNNYRAGESSQGYSSDDSQYSDDEEDDDDDNVTRNFGSQKEAAVTNGSGKTIITKHDKEICNRRNVGRMESSFPAGFHSGDISGMDLQISNRTYNSLKQHAFSEERRGQRLHEAKDHYTAEHALDEKTRLILHKLVSNGTLSSVNSIISVGKESVVVHADGGDSAALKATPTWKTIKCDNIPSECAIKVYKTTLNEFRSRDRYIKDDYRFKDRFKKLNPRKIIHLWAEKEMCNLERMRNAGIPCPEVVLLKKHILVMSFIGTDSLHAPKLKYATLNSSQKKTAYSQVVGIMKTLFGKCRLVHADLSEYNLLWKSGTVWVIDVSQSVEPNHPHGLEFLYRDCQNISRFFNSWGVPDVAEPMALFNEVSGLDLPTSDEGTFKADVERRQNMSEEHSHQSLNKAKLFVE